MIAIEPPHLLFLGDAEDELAAKTARGLADWRRDLCLGQHRLPGCRADLGLPDLTVAEAAGRGARTMVIGVANRGGILPESWVETVVEALERGLDVASGLHMRLRDIAPIAAAAERAGRRLFDVRHPTGGFGVGDGERRPGRRLLTVGTDCSIGKMYTSLAIEREMRARGLDADFRATGQTGILIAGSGVSIDAVVADFIAGAAEWLTPAAAPDHWDIVEGQGSLFHPSYAGVTLGLIHGTQPDALVLCHDPARAHMRGLPGRPLPDLGRAIVANVEAARLTNPDCRCAGLAIITAGLSEAEARRYLDRTSDAFGLPCVDPMRTGVGPIVDALV